MTTFIRNKMPRFRLVLLLLIYLALSTTTCIATFVLEIDPHTVQKFILPWFTLPFQLMLVAFYFFVAFVIYRLSWSLAGRLLHSLLIQQIFLFPSNYLIHELSPNSYKTYVMTPRQSLQYLVSSTINLLAFSVAGFFSLTVFFSAEIVAMITGLVTAGFGFGARTMIGDLLAGAGNIFEDNFDVHDKVEMAHTTGNIEGTIESLTLRTITIRAPTGELFVVPNGEARILRNFSRGAYSVTKVHIKVITVDLQQTLDVLDTLNKVAVELLPRLLKPWIVVNEKGRLGSHTDLTLVCKAEFGKGATLRLNLLILLHERLSQAGIKLAD